MVYSGFKLCSFVLVPKWISCLFSTGSSLSFTHFPSLCLTGAFSARLEFVNSQNTAPGWLTKCVWFLLKSMHWEHLRETDRETVRARNKKKRIEVDWGKENGRASWRLAEQWRDILCNVFPFHPWRPALHLLPLWAGRDRQRDGGMREKETGEAAWNNMEMGAKKKKKKDGEWEDKIKTSKEEMFYMPRIFIWQQKKYKFIDMCAVYYKEIYWLP